MADTTVVIIGAGIGGVYLAAEPGTLGCRLRLTDRDDSRLAEIRARGGLDVEPGGFIAIERVTTDLAAAVDGADVPTLEDWFERTYHVRGATLSETCQLLTTNSDGPYQADRKSVV